MKIPIPPLEEEMKLICHEIEQLEPFIYIPSLFLRLCLEVVRALKENPCIDMREGAGLDAAIAGRSAALSEQRSIASFDDMKAALYAALLANTVAPEKAEMSQKIEHTFPEMPVYLEERLKGIDLANIASCLLENEGNANCWNAASLKKIIAGNKGSCARDDLAKLASWTSQHESIYKYRIYDVMAEYMKAYGEGVGSKE